MPVDAYMALEREAQEAYLETLDAEALLRFGAALYNAGHFWHAHEAWEQVWMDAEREQRAFYQGLIQVTAAFVHVTRNEYPGSVRLLEEGIDKLEHYPASYLGVELAPLLEGARAAHDRLVALGEKHIADFDRGLIPTLDVA